MPSWAQAGKRSSGAGSAAGRRPALLLRCGGITLRASEEFIGLGGDEVELLGDVIDVPGVVHPRSVALELLVGEVAGHGLSVELGGPLPVGAVEAWWIVVTAAAGRAAAREALDDAAADHEAEP